MKCGVAEKRFAPFYFIDGRGGSWKSMNNENAEVFLGIKFTRIYNQVRTESVLHFSFFILHFSFTKKPPPLDLSVVGAAECVYLSRYHPASRSGNRIASRCDITVAPVAIYTRSFSPIGTEKPFRCAAPEMYFKRERRRLAPPGGSLGTPFALLLLHQCLCRMYDIIG